MKLEIVKKIYGIGPLCIGIFVNIYWMLASSIITGFISFLLNSYYTGRSLHYSSWMQIKDIAPSYGVAITIALFVYFIKYLPFSYWIILPLQVVVGVFIFFLTCVKTKLPEYIELKNIVLAPLRNKYK